MKRLGTVNEWRVCRVDLGWMVWITLRSEQGSLLLVWNCICWNCTINFALANLLLLDL